MSRHRRRFWPVLFLWLLLFLFPSCSHHNPAKPDLGIFNVIKSGTDAQWVLLDRNQELEALISAVCGADDQACEFREVGTLSIIQVRGETYAVVERNSPEAAIYAMQRLGCVRLFVCSTDGITTVIRRKRNEPE